MLDYQFVKEFVLSKNGCLETYPFGETPFVAKVGNKMFALLTVDSNPCIISLKCDPEDALLLRGMYASTQPGYHLNKEHWNTLTCDDTLPKELVFQLINDSYNLIVTKLPKKVQNSIGL